VTRPATRWLALAVVLFAAAGLLLLLAAGRTWASGTLHHDVGPTFLVIHQSRTGRSLSGVGTAAGVMALAGLAALPATRGAGRMVLGAVLLIAGAAAVVGGVAHALTPPAGYRASGWPEVSAAGGLALAVAGMLTAGPGRRWPGLSRRHDPTGVLPGVVDEGTAGRRSGGLWEALDRGEDPTGSDQREPPVAATPGASPNPEPPAGPDGRH
jgi:hypothetical protein